MKQECPCIGVFFFYTNSVTRFFVVHTSETIELCVTVPVAKVWWSIQLYFCQKKSKSLGLPSFILEEVLEEYPNLASLIVFLQKWFQSTSVAHFLAIFAWQVRGKCSSGILQKLSNISNAFTENVLPQLLMVHSWSIRSFRWEFNLSTFPLNLLLPNVFSRDVVFTQNGGKRFAFFWLGFIILLK